MSSGSEQVVQLLKELQATVVPRSVDSGEAITYLAYKDAILSKCVGLLSLADAEHTRLNTQQQLLVDHQQLATTVIERTFDTHTQVLRSQLAAAKTSAEMWKKAALFGSGSGGGVNVNCDNRSMLSPTPSIPARVNVGTQASSPQRGAADVRDSTPRLDLAFQLSAAEGLFLSWSEQVLATANKKVQLWCTAATASACARATALEDEQQSSPVAAEKKARLSSSKSSAIFPSSSPSRGAPTLRAASRSANGDAGRRQAAASLVFEPVGHGMQHANTPRTKNASLSILSMTAPHAADTTSVRAGACSSLYVMRPITLSARRPRTRNTSRGLVANDGHGAAEHLPKV